MTSDQPDVGVLINYPLKFAGATPDVIVSPAPPAGVPVEGLPQASFKEVLKRSGNREGAVQAVVDPPIGGAYLNIALYMKGPRDSVRQLIERKPVAPAEQNSQVYFDVYQSLFDDGVHAFTYDVERSSGNSGPSIESWALYHRDLPGGNDVPGTGDHPDLAISLASELGDPPQIGKEEVDRGVAVTVSYPFMKAYDRITLELNRMRLPCPFIVQPGQQGAPFVITVTREMFEQAGSNPRFPFSYTVVDQVNNPADKRRWSKVIEANVDAERVTLTPPDLSEDPDDPVDDPDTIDLGKLKDFLYVLVHVFTPLWTQHDEIQVRYSCTPPTGSAVTHSTEVNVGRLPFTHKLQVPLAKVLVDGRVSVTYEQIRDGKVIGASRPVLATVVGQGTPGLTVAFSNGPYVVAPGGRLKDVRLSLTQSGRPVAGKITVVLPVGSQYADGVGGARDFSTRPDGTLTIEGIKGAAVSGVYNLIASSDTHAATEVLTVIAYEQPGVIAVGALIQGITISSDGRRAYVGPANGRSLAVIDTEKAKVERYIPINGQGSSTQHALSRDGTRVFAGFYQTQLMEILDLENERTIASFPVGRACFNVTLSQDEALAFVSNSHDATVNVIDVRNLQSLKTITVGQAPNQIVVHPDGSRIYVAVVSSSSIVVIDSRSLTQIAAFRLKAPPIGLAMSPDGQSIFADVVVSNTTEEIVQVDAHTGALIKAIPVTGLARGIVVNHRGTRAYCCNPHTHTVSTIDIQSGAVIQRVPVGRLPLCMAISPDDSLGYVSCYEDGTVRVISLQSELVGGLNTSFGEVLEHVEPGSVKPVPGDEYLGLPG
jgi:YVTN family beta-propeller protein